MASPANHQDRDRLNAARRLVKIVVLGSLVMAGVIAVHAAFASGRSWAPARAVLDALDLSTLALVAPGRPGRVPAAPPPGIDLRYDPTMNLAPTDLVDLLRKGDDP